MARKKTPSVRNLALVLGDQLDPDSSAFDGFDAATDAVWMAEVREESTHVRSSKVRTALFFSAMRHFRDRLRSRGWTVHYRQLDDPVNAGTLAGELAEAIRTHTPKSLLVVKPGDHRVERDLERVADERGVRIAVLPDRHFFSTPEDFAVHAEGRKQLRLEFFYRELRKKNGVLMDGGQPAGGDWNYDAENRGSFGKSGPGLVPAPVDFPPDAITRAVLVLVEAQFPDHPGDLARFDWPVTAEEAAVALRDFVDHRLSSFGRYQDASWMAEPFLYHSRLSSAMNLKLLNPRAVVGAVEKAYREGLVPLPAAEGFIRQILGWREYVRGIYWRFMPEYRERNALGAHRPLPAFYWTADTESNCLKQSLGQTLNLGYAHHIQRLMVTGLFALLLGVEPQRVHEWYLAVYVDAVEWVEVPNVIGMSQFADGGIMGSKPYAASGKYIQRMSNYCKGCRYDPAESTGDRACPFTTLYWNFLMEHEARMAANPRTVMQIKNLNRLPPEKKAAIRTRAEKLRISLL